MKIYSLLLVKNEEDIIASTLRSAAQWNDKLIVLDNGSTDNTWNIVKEIAREYACIIPYEQDFQPFKIGLRSKLFDTFKNELTDDDWWCIRMDSDEFYQDNPRNFLENIPKRYKQVYKKSFDFAITHEDVQEYDFTGNFEEDRNNIRYYNPGTWSEVRFLRHSRKLQWDINEFKPQPCGMIFPKQIRVLHYQFRSPKQMQMRYEIRQKAIEGGSGSFKHEKGRDWKDYLKNRSELFYAEDIEKLETLGNRNKFNKRYKQIFKYLLTLVGYY